MFELKDKKYKNFAEWANDVKGKPAEESAVAPLNQEFPLVKTMEDMNKWFHMVEDVFQRFDLLSGRILKIINEEDYDFEKNISLIQQKISTTKGWYENNLKNAVPVELTPKNVITAIKFFCTSIDTFVFNANTQVFEIIRTGHWIDIDGQKYKSLYMGLMELATAFYNRCITLNQKHKSLIRKTKNVMGVVLNDLAASPVQSDTDDNSYEWLTQEQFNLSMKPEELKPT